MVEIEIKFVCQHLEEVKSRLVSLDGVVGETESHEDIYLRHPSRDFAVTQEALRIRRINGIAWVTYKGPKLPTGDSALKARKELEWPLSPGDSNGERMLELFGTLGFSVAACVRKERRSVRFDTLHPFHDLTITLDHVDEVGDFVEIECVQESASQEDLQNSELLIQQLAKKLSLAETRTESYLEMILAR